MKCPFCSDSIHPNAKYCPKCGLPIKDEPTVMAAAYLPDEPTMNPWMLASGGLAALALVFGIGWASSQIGRGPNPASTPQTIAAYRTTPPTTNSPIIGSTGTASPAWGASTYAARPAAAVPPVPAVTPPAAPVRWAYNPPLRTANAGFFNPLDWEPSPPRVPLLEIAKAARPREVSVSVAQSTVPPVPEEPMTRPALPAPPTDVESAIAYSAPMPGVAADGSPTPQYQQMPARTPAAATAVPESRRQWIWDPVHESWARNPEYNGGRQRRNIRNTGTYW